MQYNACRTNTLREYEDAHSGEGEFHDARGEIISEPRKQKSCLKVFWWMWVLMATSIIVGTVIVSMNQPADPTGKNGAGGDVLPPGQEDSDQDSNALPSFVSHFQVYSLKPTAAIANIQLNKDLLTAPEIACAISLTSMKSSGGNQGWVWTEVVSLQRETNYTAQLKIYRLRLYHVYNARLWIDIPGADGYAGNFTPHASSTITTLGSGYTIFDNGPFASTSGSLTFQVMTTSGSYDATSAGGPSFRGIFSFDSEGYIVWYYETGQNTYVFDWLSNGNMVMLTAHTENFDEVNPGSLLQVDIDGNVVSSYSREECEAELSSWGVLDHEVRAQDSTAIFSILTTAHRVYNTSYDRQFRHSEDAPATMVNIFAGAEVVRWTLGNDQPEVQFSLWDTLSPTTDVFNSTEAYSIFEAVCADKSYPTVLDWMHGNSVSISDYDGNLIVSLRNLNTVVSVESSSGELSWRISSSISAFSDFKFDDEASKFYSQHDVSQNSEGKLQMIDNGFSRPGCSGMSEEYAGCYSRALVLKLDMDTRIASMAWEFTPDEAIFGTYGGSLRLRVGSDSDPRMFATFCSIYRDSSDSGMSVVYEVDQKSSALLGSLSIPATNSSWNSGHYRSLTSETLAGESSTRPF